MNLQINEAAEDASNFAKEIFLNAVKAMTINDAMSVLEGDDNAATIYFKKRTRTTIIIRKI